ncbi:hypothetical protein ABZV14_09625 [Streptosporangium canum]|uniref:hypothetical protein n=1 Tax=Streptosporangium canum TaxID=324952 RepID=UPI0033B38AAE
MSGLEVAIFIGLQGSGKSTFYRQVPAAPYGRSTAGSRSTGRPGNGACPAAAARIAFGAAGSRQHSPDQD